MSPTQIRNVVVATAAIGSLIVRIYAARREWKHEQDRKIAFAGFGSRRQRIIDAALLLLAVPAAGGAFLSYAAHRYFTSLAFAALALVLWGLSWRSRLKDDQIAGPDSSE